MNMLLFYRIDMTFELLLGKTVVQSLISYWTTWILGSFGHISYPYVLIIELRQKTYHSLIELKTAAASVRNACSVGCNVPSK